MNRLLACALAFAVASVSAATLDPYGAHRKKYLAFGQEFSYITPQDFVDHAEEFMKTPLDGVGIHVNGSREHGRRYQCFREIVGRPAWTKESLADLVEPLRKMSGYRCFRESFLCSWYPPPKRVAWDDDETWAVVSNNLRLVAWLAREGRLPGIQFDIEDYTRQKQFTRLGSDPDYETTSRLARQRGRELFRGIFEEYPDITLFMFWLFSDAPYRVVENEVADALVARNDLWVPFVNGMLDVMPPTVKVVDGEEDGYKFRADRRDFHAGYCRVFNWDLPLVAKENRVRYLSQVSVSFGQYLDMYINDESVRGWYMPPLDGSRLARLEQNLRQATSAATEYVWFWSERGRWIEWTEPLRSDPERLCRNAKLVWKDVIPGGFLETIAAVKDPDGYLRPKLDRAIAAGELKPLFATADLDTWKDAAPKAKDGTAPAAPGTLEKRDGRLVAKGVFYGGCFHKLTDVSTKEGTVFYVRAKMKGAGSAGVGFKDSEDHWMYGPKYTIAPSRESDADGWREIAGFATVPADCGKVQFSFNVGGLAPEETVEFRDVGVYLVK